MKKLLLVGLCLFANANAFAFTLTSNPEKVGFWLEHKAGVSEEINFTPPVIPVILHVDLYEGSKVIGKLSISEDIYGRGHQNAEDINSNCLAIQKEAERSSVNKKIIVNTDENGLVVCSLSSESRS